MALRPFAGSCLTPEQLDAIGDAGLGTEDVVDLSCRQVNTCGRDGIDVLADPDLDLYDPGRGIYGKWGDIPLPWEDESLDPRWQVALYRDDYSYRVGDQVIQLADNGYLIIVYEAIADLPVPPGAFNSSLWTEVCRVQTSDPIGIPSYSELLSLYPYYDPRQYLTRWGEFDSGWEDDLTEPDSDEWSKARILKGFFYLGGDIVLYDAVCDNFTCAYVATDDMPADPALIVPGPPPAAYWRRLYCVENGRPDKCVKRLECDLPNRKIVSLSDGFEDLVCVPVESRVGVKR